MLISLLFAEVGLEAQKYIKEGKLVPDEVMIKFIICELEEVEDEAWLLDGKYVCYDVL